MKEPAGGEGIKLAEPPRRAAPVDAKTALGKGASCHFRAKPAGYYGGTLEFSIMFWGDVSNDDSTEKSYEDLLSLAKYADEHHYAGVWLPERHFHPWGGMHPNPSVLAAAIASITKRLRIRSGSVVLPLHDPIRVAEEWAVVDNLSHGRVELSIATGWRENDFAIAPENYKGRKKDAWSSLSEVQQLWRGDAIERSNGLGQTVSVRTYPQPIQQEIPLWITSSGSLRTMADAGGNGFNLLTHLLGQTYETLESKVAQYKAYRVRNGHNTSGKIALMLHTFLGSDIEEVRNTTRAAMSSYLLNSADLAIPDVQREDWEHASKDMMADMIEVAFNRYFDTASLMGTVDSCKETVRRVAEIGVTEICCLIDFGLPLGSLRDSMDRLTELKQWADSGCK